MSQVYPELELTDQDKAVISRIKALKYEEHDLEEAVKKVEF